MITTRARVATIVNVVGQPMIKVGNYWCLAGVYLFIDFSATWELRQIPNAFLTLTALREALVWFLVVSLFYTLNQFIIFYSISFFNFLTSRCPIQFSRKMELLSIPLIPEYISTIVLSKNILLIPFWFYLGRRLVQSYRKLQNDLGMDY